MPYILLVTFKYNNTTSSPRKGPLNQWGQSTYFKTLSLVAPYAPPCPTALGLIGPKKRKKKLVLMTSSRSDWT
jgi:hypothetical protein